MTSPCPRCTTSTYWPRDEDNTPHCHACGFSPTTIPSWLRDELAAGTRRAERPAQQGRAAREREMG